jgi:hypothetical protein
MTGLLRHSWTRSGKAVSRLWSLPFTTLPRSPGTESFFAAPPRCRHVPRSGQDSGHGALISAGSFSLGHLPVA